MTAGRSGLDSTGRAHDRDEARGADQTITGTIDAHIVTEQGRDDDGAAGALVPVG